MEGKTHIRVFTAFSGYDSQCLALDRLAKDYPQFSYDRQGEITKNNNQTQ